MDHIESSKNGQWRRESTHPCLHNDDGCAIDKDAKGQEKEREIHDLFLTLTAIRQCILPAMGRITVIRDLDEPPPGLKEAHSPNSPFVEPTPTSSDLPER